MCDGRVCIAYDVWVTTVCKFLSEKKYIILACYLNGITVNIVGITASDSERSCEKHKICGFVMAPDVVVRIRARKLEKKAGEEATALLMYHVTSELENIA